MRRAEKRLESMKANPKKDWGIADVRVVCEAFGITCNPPKRGTHHKISHPDLDEILTIPSDRPIKAVYIRLLVSFIERALEYG